MNVSLTPQLEAMVRQKVESGMYNNASEVVREALRLLDANDRMQRLRQSLIEAEDEYRREGGGELTPDLFQRLRAEAIEMRGRGIEPDPDVCP